MTGMRKIDTIPAPSNSKEIKVMVFGMSRTGTWSIKNALERLGLKTYHASEMVPRFPSGHIDCWLEAMDAKYAGKGTPFGRNEFEKLLGEFDATSDIPTILFVDELLASYPEAKVILMERDPDPWVRSVKAVFHVILGWKTNFLLETFDSVMWGPYMRALKYPLSIWSSGRIDDDEALKQGYIKHNRHVREVVSREKLLIMHPPWDYKPLCDFLDVDVPTTENAQIEGYPKVNDKDYTVQLHHMLYWMRVQTIYPQLLWKSIIPITAACLMYVAWLLKP